AGEADGGDDGVTRPGHVEDLARGGRDVEGTAARLEEGHALLAAGDEGGRALKPAEDRLAGGEDVRLGPDPYARRLLRFALVRRDEGDAAIEAEVRDLGVHEDGHATAAGQGQDRLHHRGRDDSL